MKKVCILISCVIIMSLAGCSRQAQTSGASFQPPIDGIEWGMMPDEVMDALSLSEECIQKYSQDNVEWTAVLQCGNMEIFEQNADVVMVFDLKSQIGLLTISVCFPDASEESLSEMLVDAYGEHSAVNAEGNPCLWENEKIEELPEEIQERFRYMWMEFLPREGEQENIFKEAIWNAHKAQPLVTVALNGNVLIYTGGNMAEYLIYNDDAAYEQLQDLRSGN